jgi:hypothetical protein
MVEEPKNQPVGPFVLMVSAMIGTRRSSTALENAVLARALERSRVCKIWDS